MILDRVTPPSIVPAIWTATGTPFAIISGDQYTGRDIREQGAYSPAEIALWRDLLCPGAIVADVGANIGAQAVPLGQIVGPTGLVLAFEPLPWLYRLLVTNTVLAGQSHVLPFHAAVGARPGSIRVPGIDYTVPDTYGGLALGQYDQGNSVAVVTLDQMAAKLDAVKIDVEGMELDVLHGARRHLAAGADLYLEAVPPADATLIAFLRCEGYQVWRHAPPRYPDRPDSPTSPMLLARKNRPAPAGHGLEAA